MLLSYHDGYGDTTPAEKPKRRRNRKARDEKPTAPEAPASVYADLTDDELQDAYVTNVGNGSEGAPEDRDAMVAALEALDAEAKALEAPADE